MFNTPLERKAGAVVIAAMKKKLTALDVLLKHAQARELESTLLRDATDGGPWRVQPAACMRSPARQQWRSDCFPQQERDDGGRWQWRCRNVPFRTRTTRPYRS